ncbi:hypothetical protein AHAS_Ahas10G0196800 [Arachis hypogaea]
MLKPGVRRVNSVGAKVLEFIADFGKPTAPLPAAIVACVPTKVHIQGAGKTEFKISPTEITDAMKAGLDQPIMPEPEDEEHENKGKDESCEAFESGVVNAQYYRTVGDKILPFSKIIVDSLGHGNFSTIQSAIDSVPSNNKYWVSINVKPGIYREKVTIPIDKPYIILKGSEKMRTWVEWDDHNTTAQSPTFQSMADNIVVKSISFRNTYNNSINKNFRVPALAALISGDKSYFYKVRFFGLQDTLWDNQGKHYYKFCTIQGAVDFIFGAGQSLFERCNINVIGRALGEGFVGYITAQGRERPKDSNGFVFKNCSISGDGSTFLGRPWRPYARVLFYSTNMTNIIQPAGWDLWNSSQNE